MGFRWPFHGLRGEQFNTLTALHPMWDRVPTWQRHVIRTQAERIRILEEQRTQMQRGYVRKIAKLESALAEASPMTDPTTQVEGLSARDLGWLTRRAAIARSVGNGDVRVPVELIDRIARARTTGKGEAALRAMVDGTGRTTIASAASSSPPVAEGASPHANVARYTADDLTTAVMAERLRWTAPVEAAPTSAAGEVEAHPDVQGGALCFVGQRIPVRAVLSFALAGYSVEAIHAEYPTVGLAQISAAMELVALLAPGGER